MYKILRKTALKPTVVKLDIEAPLIAKKARPGQFIILRPYEDSERIPLTISGYDPDAHRLCCAHRTLQNVGSHFFEHVFQRRRFFRNMNDLF